MNERISDLLDRASDDGGAPLGFSGAALVQRARAERRRRRTFGGVAVGLAAAGVAGVLAATQLLASPHASTLGPSDQTSTPATPSVPSHSSGPALTPAGAVGRRPVRAYASSGASGPRPERTGGLRGPSVGDKVRTRPAPDLADLPARLDPRRPSRGRPRAHRDVREPVAHQVGELRPRRG